jgi:hypothetical protein
MQLHHLFHTIQQINAQEMFMENIRLSQLRYIKEISLFRGVQIPVQEAFLKWRTEMAMFD